MATEAFIEWNFRSKSLNRIRQAQTIINEMRAGGYTLTLRQLYYQFVARGWLENVAANYEKLGVTIDNARKAGYIDWSAIEDRTRFLRRITTYRDLRNFITDNSRFYAEDLWRNQEHYCEVWIEKDALIGVIERPCLEMRVPYFACRGYPSSSELYVAGKRLRRQIDKGKIVTVFYLGDHDPDGIDMGRSNEKWLKTYARSGRINFNRIALNMDQIEEFNPPPNPAKESSARYAEYAAEYGDEAWELDALNPADIDALIRENVERLINRNQWDIDVARETENEALYSSLAENIDDIRRYLKYRYEEYDAGDTILSADDILDYVSGNEEGN